ncbi:CRTAC1 family protein [Pseudotamlana carrageenivorans]|uniref:CRTAC1 family protein n=1 Tax=Pseudotamlana carrageenivorans TaxID=2069432 RepID=A0A2I7SHW1_9FLAO|nr:CRTAC1 family protein [Tamlana carrageenivorans]AUS05486.1 CRTAC1 family protein [Tamlana carrageenivorans]
MKFNLFLFAFFLGFSSVLSAQDSSANTFVEVFKAFPRTEKNLRKWDAPVVADLDQDGFIDLIINDHGYGVQVLWNNNGKFAKPFDVLIGDLHGVSVGDFDADGNLEMIISRGGGSGSNARNSKMYRVSKNREFIPLPDFNEPLALMRGRTVKFVDADNDGDLDLLNFAFPDSNKQGESENYVYENNGQAQLVLKNTLPSSHGDGQKVLLTDFNQDGIFDIVMYGHGKVRAFQGIKGLDYKEVTETIFPFSLENVTSISEIDVDNDGRFDLYFTRGLDFEKGETFFDAETKTWGFYTKRGEFDFSNLEAGDVLKLTNFQSQWPNNATYFIGESAYSYTFESETHSGKNITLVNSDALGFPDHPNFKENTGWYIGYTGNESWRIAGYLWAPATGVVQSVSHYPKYEHSEGLSDVLLKNTGGKFTDVTKKYRLDKKEHTVAASVADVDNNGFKDLVVIPRGDLIHENKAIVYLNTGKSEFNLFENHSIISKELGAIGMAIETLDYNQDGRMDVVVGNERGLWHLFKNQFPKSKNSNFINVSVGHSNSGNCTALGAKVTLSSCGNTRSTVIGSTSAAYSLSFSNLVHFGLGDCTKAVRIKVSYTNGEVIEKKIKTLNGVVSVGKK